MGYECAFYNNIFSIKKKKVMKNKLLLKFLITSGNVLDTIGF